MSLPGRLPPSAAMLASVALKFMSVFAFWTRERFGERCHFVSVAQFRRLMQRGPCLLDERLNFWKVVRLNAQVIHISYSCHKFIGEP